MQNKELGNYEKRRHTCEYCGKDFTIPPIGKYPYKFKLQGKRRFCCSEHCKRMLQESAKDRRR